MSLVHQNWWFTTLLVKSHNFCPPLSKSLKCDVLIVGGGVSGISAAAEFVKQGKSVVLIEREHRRRRFDPSRIQIALFVAPALVLASYFISPQPLEFAFSRAEIGAMFLTVLIGAFVAGDGRSNWFKGIQLITVYAMIAILFYFLPVAKH